jgi:hypothetical protein
MITKDKNRYRIVSEEKSPEALKKVRKMLKEDHINVPEPDVVFRHKPEINPGLQLNAFDTRLNK